MTSFLFQIYRLNKKKYFFCLTTITAIFISQESIQNSISIGIEGYTVTNH